MTHCSLQIGLEYAYEYVNERCGQGSQDYESWCVCGEASWQHTRIFGLPQSVAYEPRYVTVHRFGTKQNGTCAIDA